MRKKKAVVAGMERRERKKRVASTARGVEALMVLWVFVGRYVYV